MIHVNHVLSSRVLKSRIFDDIFQRLLNAAPADMRLTCTERHERGASLRHYHRPHREQRLLNPAVVTIHHDPRETHPSLQLKYFLERWRQADRVICLNSFQQNLLSELGIERTVRIPHGIDRAVLPQPSGPRPDRDEKLYLGIISKRYPRGIKGEHRLTHLFESLDPAQFGFVLVGEGRWRDAQAAAAKGFAVRHYEALPYRLFGELYQQIDYLLILSDYEGGPACLPEALGSGVPVLARPVGMVSDWIKDGENGMILDNKHYIEQIRSLTDHNLRHQLNAGAYLTAPDIPSWQQVCEQQIHLYKALVS